MVRKSEFYALAAIAILFLLLVAYNQDGGAQQQQHVRIMKLAEYMDNMADLTVTNATAVHLSALLRLQEHLLNNTLSSYRFPAGASLQDHLLAKGGAPLRSVIVTTWRSGSTFLGDVINAVPGNFYHYEPLLDYGEIQIRGAPHAESALATLKHLFNCDYGPLRNYIEFGREHNYLFTHNTRLWEVCEAYGGSICWNATFLSQFCRLFPFQSAKIVRLRLHLAKQLLEMDNVKIVLLVRDPRGILQSRKHRVWCPGQPDCDKPNLLCDDLVADYSAALELNQNYPDRFGVIRYEDLSLNTEEMVPQLLDFFGLYFHQNVRNFLATHTKMDLGGVSSTFRDSKSAPFQWRMKLNYSEVQYIEENCDEAMRLWGYLKAKNESHLHDFNPLGSYKLSD